MEAKNSINAQKGTGYYLLAAFEQTRQNKENVPVYFYFRLDTHFVGHLKSVINYFKHIPSDSRLEYENSTFTIDNVRILLHLEGRIEDKITEVVPLSDDFIEHHRMQFDENYTFYLDIGASGIITIYTNQYKTGLAFNGVRFFLEDL